VKDDYRRLRDGLNASLATAKRCAVLGERRQAQPTKLSA
jgi:hypothetical protein